MTRRRARGRKAPRPILAPFFRRKGGSRQPPTFAALASSAASLAFVLLAACHSYHIDTTVENRTTAPIQLLEVDYPSASFGADAIPSGAVFQYRFQVRGTGPLKLSYTGADGKQVQITGPTLTEPVQGQLRIVLLPGGKAQFQTKFTPPR